MKKSLFAFAALLCLGPGSWAETGAEVGWGAYLAGDHKKALELARPAAEAGDYKAQQLLGYLYATGDQVPKDEAKARMWLTKCAAQAKKLAAQGDVTGEQVLGWLYTHGFGGLKQDYAQALKWQRKAADQGGMWAQWELGALYQNGQGVKQDYVEAAKLYRASAEQGNPYAQSALGSFYQLGQGVKLDYDEALKWYRLAADQGFGDAEQAVGWFYQAGWGVKQDSTEGLKWARKSAARGNQWGQRLLGLFYQNGWAVKQDYAEAVKWLRKSAEQGNYYAQNELAGIYYNGTGLKQDYAEAAKWYRKSAEQGNADAQWMLGYLHQNGWGVEKNLGEAFKWYKKSSDQGNQWGQNGAATCYFWGWGVKTDDAEAARLWQLALDQGNAYAPNGLGYLYRVGRAGFPKDSAKALQFFRTGYERGDLVHSPGNLGGMYENGEGVTQDYVQAYRWYLISAAHEGPVRDALERLKALMTKEQVAEAQKLAAAAQPQPAAPEKKLASDVDEPGFRLKEDPQGFAVVVGIEKYKDLPQADFAERDAEAVRANLLALGYPERNVLLLKGSNATISGLRKYLDEWLPRNVTQGGTVFFYFSGHGAPDPKTGEAYLVPWDGDARFLKSTAYPVRKLYASLGALPAAKIWVALDSCFSGAGGRSVLAKGARPLVTKVEGTLPPKGKLVLLAAASGDEITGTLESEGHGLFTYYLLRGMGDAAKAGGAQLDARRLYDYLKPKVQDAARRQNRDQTPVLAGAPQERRP
ncbi:MAG: caspase family protein [Elusimicrobia bacterium]|nr:caspase family protein [Elusimicrobiota bacterium]